MQEIKSDRPWVNNDELDEIEESSYVILMRDSTFWRIIRYLSRIDNSTLGYQAFGLLNLIQRFIFHFLVLQGSGRYLIFILLRFFESFHVGGSLIYNMLM